MTWDFFGWAFFRRMEPNQIQTVGSRVCVCVCVCVYTCVRKCMRVCACMCMCVMKWGYLHVFVSTLGSYEMGCYKQSIILMVLAPKDYAHKQPTIIITGLHLPAQSGSLGGSCAGWARRGWAPRSAAGVSAGSCCAGLEPAGAAATAEWAAGSAAGCQRGWGPPGCAGAPPLPGSLSAGFLPNTAPPACTAGRHYGQWHSDTIINIIIITCVGDSPPKYGTSSLPRMSSLLTQWHHHHHHRWHYHHLRRWPTSQIQHLKPVLDVIITDQWHHHHHHHPSSSPA